MNPYAKFGWVLYSLFALALIIPVGWAISWKLSGMLAERSAFVVGFVAAAVFLGLPFIGCRSSILPG